MEENYGIVILTGGQGKRMGYVEKEGLLYKERTFLSCMRKELSYLKMPVFLSTGKDFGKKELPAGIKVLKDLPFGEKKKSMGPMGGIWSCFKQTELDSLLFLPCDMPFIRAMMAKRLTEERDKGYDAILWRTRDGRLQPLCGLYSKTCLPVLEECLKEENYRMTYFLSRISCLVLDTSVEHVPDQWFFNVNDKESYELLNRMKVPVLAVSGRKNTGKTTLLTGLVSELSKRGVRVAFIKHDGHDFTADVPGTDSFSLKEAGAYGTAVYSDTRYSIVKEEKGCQAQDFIPCFPEADLILLEGQKYSQYPKLEILRSSVSSIPVCDPYWVLAYVADREWSLRPEAFPDNFTDNFRQEPPVLLLKEQMDEVLELVLQFMDQSVFSEKGEAEDDKNPGF